MSRRKWLVAGVLITLVVLLLRLQSGPELVENAVGGVGQSLLVARNADLDVSVEGEAELVRRTAAREASSEPVLRFECVSGDAIPGVVAWLHRGSPEASQRLGADASGEVRMPDWAQSADAELIALREGYRPLAVRLEAPHPPERVVVLEEADSVTGLIVDTHGRSVTTQPTVVAYLEGHAPSKGELRQALSGAPSVILHTRVAVDGTFVLAGLIPATEYRLLVGGGGVALLQPRYFLAGSTGVLIEVQALFAARVTFDSIPAELVPWEPPGPRWFWDPAVAEAKGVDSDSLSGILAGFLPEETTRLPSTPLALLFAGPPDKQAIGPISFLGTPAGYDPIDVQMWIPRALEAPSTLVVATTSRASLRGRARIEFRGLLPEEYDPSNRAAPLGLLWFHSEDGQSTLQVPLSDLSRSLDVAGIPCGLYAVSLSTESGFSNYPAVGELTAVRTAEPARIVFELEQACSLELFAQDATGELVQGEILVEVCHWLDGACFSSFITLRKAPHIVHGLIPGEYRLKINKPYFNPEPVPLTLTQDSRRATAVFLPRRL